MTDKQAEVSSVDERAGSAAALLAADPADEIASVACDDDVAQCSGCGEYRGTRWIGTPHACWRNENGSYEEGGTFQ